MATVHNSNPFVEKMVALGARLSLSPEKFEEVSKQAERELKEQPALYKARVVWLAIAGYAFIFAVVAIFIGTFVAAVKFLLLSHHGGIYSLKLIIILGGLLLVLVKALWVKIEPPQGITLEKEDYPELFSMVFDLSSRLNTKVDKILLDDRFNASVVQVPRLGMFGMHEHYLTLGLPLMLALSKEQFISVLAHEMGHLSGNHSRSVAWIYSLRRRWVQLLQAFADQSAMFFFAPFYLFFSWFSPRFDAYTLAMARAHELEADSESVKITGVQSFSESMLLAPYYDKLLDEKFWPAVYEKAKTEEEPPHLVFSEMAKLIYDSPVQADLLKSVLEQELKNDGSGVDSHPPLRTRLFKGHFEPVWQSDAEWSVPKWMLEKLSQPTSLQDSAAYNYLGAKYDHVTSVISQDWSSVVAPGWSQQYEVCSNVRTQLADLFVRAAVAPLAVPELVTKAGLMSFLYDEKVAVPVYEEILAHEPDSLVAHKNLAKVLLLEDDERGLHHLERAVSSNFNAAGLLAPLAIQYLQKQGRQGELQKFEQMLKEHERLSELARKERSSLSGNSELEPHCLSDEEKEYLVNVFKEIKEIESVWVARLKVNHLPECPYLILGVDIHIPGLSDHSEEKLGIARWLLENLSLSEEFCVTTFDLGTAKLKKKMQNMTDARIYRKAV